MRKYKILFFSVLLFLAACSGDKIPDNIIKPEQMTSLLLQIHLADGTLYTVTQIPDSLYKYGTARYQALFKKFDTDSLSFKRSYRYYSLHPELLTVMYDKITANLKQKVDSLTKLDQIRMQQEAKRRADSIKRIPPEKRRADSIRMMESARKREDSIRKLYLPRTNFNLKNKKLKKGLKHRTPPNQNALPAKQY
jgi:hypothetical protein